MRTKIHGLGLGLVLAWSLAAAVGCGDDGRPPLEHCSNGTDDDGDGLTDCDDTDDCATAVACAGGEDCGNGIDDDGDGDTDCDDTDCDAAPACAGDEICTNGVDDDGDGDTDCDDAACATFPTCVPDEVCDNGADDDGDGDTDCDDTDCDTAPVCTGDENCANGADDDGDGDTDCDDADCTAAPVCTGAEDCDNRVDDDGDGDTDCDDDACAADPACLPDEDCDNGADDDGDGDTDCDDADCAADPACLEDCTNGTDDDGDGLVDCLDPGCDGAAACAELCNGLDDDGDGRTDESPTDPTFGDACYEGPAAVRGIGACVEGTVACVAGALVCDGWVGPGEEVCDGLDTDCDGVLPPDEATAGCSTTWTPGALARLELATEPRDVDVQIDLDTTGSMGGELAELRRSLGTTIVPQVRAILPTANFGVSTFDDFPLGSFGGDTDLPFVLHQRITSEVTSVQAALDAIALHYGADMPESGIEALYQIATGAGVSWASSWTAEDCNTWGDEDDDGASDCADLDCYADADCYRLPAESCANGTDDDGDGYIDCNDPNCIPSSSCVLVAGTCGNRVINTGEQCDDGNTTALDGCSATCQRESGCGNAYVGGTEQCDDGNRVAGDGCSATCMLEPGTCGDGRRWPGEQCDDGNTTAGDGCSATCTAEPRCGDGIHSTGEGCDDGNTTAGDGCSAACTGEGRAGVPAFDAGVGFDAALGHGRLGGVGFRESALPIVVHITDAMSHDAADYAAYDVDAHDSVATFAALEALGVRILGVRTADTARGSAPTDLLGPLGMVIASDAVVPLCAFDGSVPRSSGVCGTTECCTGIAGDGVAPVGGECPLVFDTSDTGTGLGEAVVTGIDALSRFATYELSVVIHDDPSDAIDATCFIDSLAIGAASPPTGACSVTPVPTDTDGDTLADTLIDATPRTRVTFEVEAVNQDLHDVDGDGNTTESCAGPGSYGLILELMADGRTLVSTRRATVVVP